MHRRKLQLLTLLAFVSLLAWACSAAQPLGKSPYLSSLETRRSEIPGAGEGVFAVRPLPAGADLGGYEGKWITDAEWRELWRKDQWHYVMSLPECAYPSIKPYTMIDGRLNGSIHAKINYAPAAFQNTEIAFFCEAPYARILTKRSIAAGEELLMDYGPDYNYFFMKDPKVKNYFAKRQRLPVSGTCPGSSGDCRHPP